MTRFLAPFLGLCCTISVFGQTKLEFEVASVRAVGPPDAGVAIGLRLDGSQAHIVSLPMRDLIAMAFRVRLYQISGPDWMRSERFDVNGKLPAGSNADQVPDMMLSLLQERFGLKFHREQKDQPVYTLTLDKTPLKLEKSAQEPGAAVAAGVRSVTGTGDADGVSVDLGGGSYYSFKNNKFEIKRVTMDTLARLLERYLDRPLVNMTGLDGTYDLTLAVTQEDYYTLLIRAGVNSGVNMPAQAMQLLERGSISSLIDALQQLGVKLEARKAPLDMVMVDQVSKTPTAN